jgi:hypothetical protein
VPDRAHEHRRALTLGAHAAAAVALGGGAAAADPCTAAADALDVGDAPDLTAIKVASEKACAGDCAEACVAAGHRRRGLTLARARCDSGDADGCHLAGVLGERPSFGRRACDFNVTQACNELME